MTSSKTIFLFWVLLFSFSPAAFSEEKALIRSGPDQAALLELFTSEGCASCPPADNWFSGLKNARGLWTAFVPVSFHVDYWDRLGWDDIWDDPEHTKLQRSYVAKWKSNSVYTPMIVKNGEEFRDWYKTPVLKIKPKKNVGILEIREISGGEFEISFFPHNGKWMSALRLSVVYMGFGIESRVKAGENRGKLLKHNFSVLDYEEVPLQYRQGVLKARVTLEPKNKETAKQFGVAAWINEEGSVAPIQAAGGFIS